MILLLSHSEDVHTKAIEFALTVKHADFRSCYIDELFANPFTLNISNNSGHQKDLLKEDFFVVLNRRPLDYLTSLTDTRINSNIYRAREYREIVFSLFSDQNSTWINHPDVLQVSSKKILQLQFTSVQQFPSPASIITNEIEELRAFCDSHHSVIGKPLASHKSYNEKNIFTTEVDVTLIGQKQLEICPVLFQEKIHKTKDIRVTVIGQKMFGAQTVFHKNDHIDWRFEQNNRKWSYWSPTSTVEQFIIKFMEHFNLRFAAFDFVEDVNRQVLFLEANPNGQWLWIQKETQQDIADAIAEYLLNLDKQ